MLPAGTIRHLPIAVGLMTLPQTEAELLQLAYLLEQALPPVPEPGFIPSLELQGP